MSSSSSSLTNANRAIPHTKKTSVPSRQPHIGQQTTLSRVNRCGIKNKKLYNYCLYAMQQVQKTRAKKGFPVQHTQDHAKDATQASTSFQKAPEPELEPDLAKPNFYQNRLEKLVAKVLPEDDCEVELDDFPEKKLESTAKKTRNAGVRSAVSAKSVQKVAKKLSKAANRRLNGTIADHGTTKQTGDALGTKEKIFNTKDSRKYGKDSVEVYVKAPPEKKTPADTKEESKEHNSPVLSQRAKLGICVDDKDSNSNNNLNINMNLTMNSVEKEQSQQSSVQPNPYYLQPSSAQYWQQVQGTGTVMQPQGMPVAYGIFPTYPMMCPVVYNTNPCIYPVPAYSSFNPAFLQTTSISSRPSVSAAPRAQAKSSNEVSTNTDCLLSDLLVSLPKEKTEDPPEARPAQKEPLDTVPRSRKDARSVSPAICGSAVATPKSRMPGSVSPWSNVQSRTSCAHDSASPANSMFATTRDLSKVKKEPYMQKLYQTHAPKIALNEPAPRSDDMTAHVEVHEETVACPRKPGVSFDISIKKNDVTLNNVLNKKKLSMKERFESYAERNKSSKLLKTEKKERTKESILEMRREMMRPKNACRAKCGGGVSLEAEVVEEKGEDGSYFEPDSLEVPRHPEPNNKVKERKSVGTSGKKEKRSSLMSRLAEGGRGEISKKEMLGLTKKNYSLLPEVREKANEERKKKEIKERLKIAKELDKKRRMMMKRKAVAAQQ